LRLIATQFRRTIQGTPGSSELWFALEFLDTHALNPVSLTEKMT